MTEVVCGLFNCLIVLYTLVIVTLHSTLFGNLIQKRGAKKKSMLRKTRNLKFIIGVLAIVNKIQLPIFSLCIVANSASNVPVSFFFPVLHLYLLSY